MTPRIRAGRVLRDAAKYEHVPVYRADFTFGSDTGPHVERVGQEKRRKPKTRGGAR